MAVWGTSTDAAKGGDDEVRRSVLAKDRVRRCPHQLELGVGHLIARRESHGVFEQAPMKGHLAPSTG
jgi:hypothetical protein